MLRARLILASLGLAFLAIISLGVNAQDTKTAPQGNRDDIITAEQQLARQFGEFLDSLVRLKQRLQRGTPEEQKRAKILGEVVDECKNLAINQEFSKMIEILKGIKGNNLQDFQTAQEQSDRLASALSKILGRLRDGANTDISAERKKLEDFLKELGKVIEKQEIVQAQIHQNKTDKGELKDNQKNVTKATDKLKEGIDKYLDKKGEGQEANQKGENKSGGKEDGAKGEAKNDGKTPEGPKGEAKNEGNEKSPGPKGEAKTGEKKSGDGDKGEPKAGAKAGDKGKEGSPEAGAKKGDKKGAEGSAKGNDKGDKKGQEGAAKDSGGKGDPKKDGQQGTAKGGDDKKGNDKQAGPDSQAKAGEPKAGDPKAGDPKAAGAKDSKGGDKGSEAKSGGDPKSGDSKQGDAKAGDSKSGQGQAKAGGEGGDPKEGGGQPPQAGQKGDNSPPPPPGSKQNDDVAKTNKKIQEAGYDQKSAENNIPKDQQAAGKNAADAVQKLKDAQKQLEKLLQQMREEELERVLAALQARCEKMLMMQQQVLVGTEDLHKVIQKHADKKPTRENKNASLALSDKEKEIVLEANKCIDILEAEGSAVAFPEVFQQIRQDMIHVQKRLELTDVADVTQGIERDIVDTLKEMIEALKKARQDNQDSKSKPGEPGKSGKPGDQKLLELIQELKMVRSLQKRVNDRTTTYGKRFPGQEQAADPQIVRELRSLAERQMRIQEIVSRISKGDNK